MNCLDIRFQKGCVFDGKLLTLKNVAIHNEQKDVFLQMCFQKQKHVYLVLRIGFVDPLPRPVAASFAALRFALLVVLCSALLCSALPGPAYFTTASELAGLCRQSAELILPSVVPFIFVAIYNIL